MTPTSIVNVTPATISAALVHARPGTAIVLADGLYPQLTLPRGLSGAPGAPIWIGAKHWQKAVIQGGISGGGCKHLVLEGLHARGGDKAAIQISMNGFDYTAAAMITDITVSQCLAEGAAMDGIKVNGGNNVWISNNVARGGGGGQGIDVDSLNGFTIEFNDASSAGSSAIICKMGSRNGVIGSNLIHGASDGLGIGDHSGPQKFPPWAVSNDRPMYEAGKILAIDNQIDVAGRCVVFVGARDSVVKRGSLINTGKYALARAAVSAAVTGGHGDLITTGCAIDSTKTSRPDNVAVIDTGCDLALASLNPSVRPEPIVGPGPYTPPPWIGA